MRFVAGKRCDECRVKAARWYSDNNDTRSLRVYCSDCEDDRASRYGCAMMLDEGCGCVPGGEDCACGCGGSGRLD